jgi:sulfur relay (sulfurtransferase) complex TusBCD TusD component (DsrE family)
MNKHDRLSNLQRLCDQAFKTWMHVFDRENEVKSCQEAWRVRGISARAMMRLQRRSECLKQFKQASGLH